MGKLDELVRQVGGASSTGASGRTVALTVRVPLWMVDEIGRAAVQFGDRTRAGLFGDLVQIGYDELVQRVGVPRWREMVNRPVPPEVVEHFREWEQQEDSNEALEEELAHRDEYWEESK
jgi:hypothetical protein